MPSYVDRIKPTDSSIYTYLENLKHHRYQIPTFQREIVWEEEDVKKLWDSIYHFYPFGSILVWNTSIKLHQHRAIGGSEINSSFETNEYQYIIDGQQRTTALFTSLYGGNIKQKDNFDPTLYVDLTVMDGKDPTDDESYKKRFLFWSEIDDRGGELKANVGKKQRFNQGLVVKLQDITSDFEQIERRLYESGYIEFDHPCRSQLRRIKSIMDNYRIPFIELQGIQVAEVCQIFERINQEGRPLGIFDIVVAKTYRPEDKINQISSFYLRDLFEEFRRDTLGRFTNIPNLTLLQMLAVIVRTQDPDSGILNITERYLNNLKTAQIEHAWDSTKKAAVKVFDFFDNVLHLPGPNLIPYRYLYMTLTPYFHNNDSPDYELLKRYFWYYSFHNDDLLTNTTHLWAHINFLSEHKTGKFPEFKRFLIDKQRLRSSSYSSRGRLSRAILSLYSNRGPLDWDKPYRSVISDVYYVLADKPNLHHIFPLGFIEHNPGDNKLDSNSLMNIAYLTQITNLNISADNPLYYLRDLNKARSSEEPSFHEILQSQLIPQQIVGWSRLGRMPVDALDQFIELRVDLIIDQLRSKLQGIPFEVIDTKEQDNIDQTRQIDRSS